MTISIRTIPVLHLSYGNVLLAEIGRRGWVSIDALLREIDPETLYKSDRPHRDPAGRARQILRFAADIGLVDASGDSYQLSPAGHEYVARGVPSYPFATSSGQAELLRDLILDMEARSGMARGALLALSLLESSDAAPSPEELGRAIAIVADKTTWRRPQTFISQGERFAAFLEDAELIDAYNRLTPSGFELLAKIDLPNHPPLREVLRLGEHPSAVARDDATIHLVLKWSAKLDADTIDRHLEIAAIYGEVWWRVYGTGKARGLSKRRIEQFEDQLRDARRTYVYLVGDTCARAELVAIQPGPPGSDERHLIPDYYDSSAGVLWVKLRDFSPVSADWLESELVLERNRSKFVRGRGDRRFAVVVQRSDDDPRNEEPAVPYREPPFEAILSSVQDSGMEIGERMLRRYHLALKTRGFVILSGVSGTGKTWLTNLYAAAVGAEYEQVAVAPNWTTNEDLLGYLNPFDDNYRDSAFSLFLRAACDEHRRAQRRQVAPKPFHLVLDEMNLARVEHYFAKFLSAMEGRARDGTASIRLAPDDVVLLPPNLHFIGTVNVDETTHGFADKVYDRAQMLEVELTSAGIERHLEDRPYGGLVFAVWEAMLPVAPFAYRTLDEIARYVDASIAIDVPLDEAVDEQILHKVLPKLSGSDPRVGEVLTELRDLTADSHPLSRAKIERMLASVEQHGFASYF